MRIRCTVLLAALMIIMPSLAASAQGTTGTIQGSVTTPGGVPLAAAEVNVTGPTSAHATTDGAGKFTIASLAPGIYRVDVTKGGYVPASTDDVTVLGGSTVPLQVVLQQADLSSLRTIARVVSSARSSINTGAAAVSIASREDFTNLASPLINDVVQRIPGAVVEHGSSSPNTSISLAGSQGYETQVLLDGHPLSAGRYGVWFSQFFNSFLVQNVETEIGPGNTTPFAGTAVGGTANILTPGYTRIPRFEFKTGLDSFGSQYSSLLTSSTIGKLGYVLGVGYNGENRRYFDTSGCIIDPVNKGTWNTPGAVGSIQYCGDLSAPQFSKGELLKARWNFSPSTSFEIAYVGSQGGYQPQATNYGVFTGPITIVQCVTATHCTNPADAGYIGQRINGYFMYPGSNVYNNQPFFEGQFRTALGANTLLIRPYAGNISRIIDGAGETGYPSFWYPSANSSTTCTRAFGAVGPTVNGYTDCLNTIFSVLESDKLKGGTVSFIHPAGGGEITGTYDYHSDETFAYYNTPSNVAVPDTTAKFNTLSLTGEFPFTSALTLKAGVYDTIWNLQGSQTGPFQTVNGKTIVTTIPLQRSVSRFDPHVALIYSPRSGESFRLSAGTSTTFPYASQVSGKSLYTPPSGTGGGSGSLTQKNPALNPERATEFDIGMDKRFGDGTILSLDLADTQIANVFETVSSPPVPPNPLYGVVYQPVNAANLSSQMAMLTLRHQPTRGWGFYATGTLARSIPTGIPITSSSFSVPANGVQQCSDGGSAVCIPYFKGYASVSYTAADGTFGSLGADIEGKNNTYFQPPFIVYDMVLRRPITPAVDVQLSTYNVFNNNTFSGLVTPNAGVPILGENSSGQYGNYLESLPFPMVPLQPRTVRLEFRFHNLP